MARTTAAAVQGILGGNYDGSSSLTPYIDSAASLIDDVAECATARGRTLSAVKLEILERWAAAHYYTVMDPIYKSKNTGDAGASFNDRSYMDEAVRLDPSGCLKALTAGQRAGADWLGKRPSEQIPYEQRW